MAVFCNPFSCGHSLDVIDSNVIPRFHAKINRDLATSTVLVPCTTGMVQVLLAPKLLLGETGIIVGHVKFRAKSFSTTPHPPSDYTEKRNTNK